MTISGRQSTKNRLPVFTPTQLSGCVLWLRADQGLTINAGVTGSISQWNDMSGQGHNFTQATPGAQPSFDTLNNLPSVRFNRTNANFMQVTAWNLPIGMDIFVVGKLATSTAGQQAFYDKGNNGDGHQNTGYFQTNSTSLNCYAGVGFTATVPDATLATGIYRFMIQNTNSAIYLNGVQKATGTSGDPGAPKGGIGFLGSNISGAANLDGWISEIIEFNNVLSSGAASRVTQYLGARYGIGVTL